MSLRTLHHFHRKLAGMSLVEIAFVLLIVGIMLGGTWIWARSINENLSVSDATRQVITIIQAIRKAHPTDRIQEDENIALLDLPLQPDLKPVIGGKTFLRSPWIGPILLYPGHAVGWGGDLFTNHFTISYERVPQNSCYEFIKSVTASSGRSMGLMAVYISAAIGKGDLYCLGTDLYCKSALTSLPELEIKERCSQKSYMTVMFTYNAQGN